MKEPPPRKRGRKSRRAAAAADLVPDEPFEDVRARARQERAISNECFSCGVAVPQLARKCLEHVISAVCTPVSSPFGRPPAHCCPLRQVEPLREYNDHFETTLTGEARARARGCIARASDLPPLQMRRRRSTWAKRWAFSGCSWTKTAPCLISRRPCRARKRTNSVRRIPLALATPPSTLNCPQIPQHENGWALSMATISRFGAARPRKARPLSRARALRSGAHHARHPPRHQRRHPPLLGTPVRV